MEKIGENKSHNHPNFRIPQKLSGAPYCLHPAQLGPPTQPQSLPPCCCLSSFSTLLDHRACQSGTNDIVSQVDQVGGACRVVVYECSRQSAYLILEADCLCARLRYSENPAMSRKKRGLCGLLLYMLGQVTTLRSTKIGSLST